MQFNVIELSRTEPPRHITVFSNTARKGVEAENNRIRGERRRV